MNTCENCKHWQREGPSSDGTHLVERNCHVDRWQFARDFIKKHGIAHYGECNHRKFEMRESIPPIDGASTRHCDGYDVPIITGKDFGCIHFECIR